MQRIEISQKSILFVFVVIIAGFLIHQLRDLLVLLFLALIFSSALNPLVKKLQHFRFPRPLAILSVYVLVIGALIGMFSYLVPPLVRESVTLVTKLHLPQLPETLEFSQLQKTIEDYNGITSRVGTSIPSVIGAVFSTFSGVLVVFTFLVLTYYLLIERDKLHMYLIWLFGKIEPEKRAKHFIDRLELELGGWVRGELFLMLVIGTMTYIGLRILGVQYALPLAIFAGLLEAIPNIGPTISAVPSVVVAFFTMSPAMGVAVILLYVLVQQLENNIIVPKIMSKAVDISPLVALIALIAGLRLGGVPGAALAIPTFIFIRAVVREFFQGKNPLHSLEEI